MTRTTKSRDQTSRWRSLAFWLLLLGAALAVLFGMLRFLQAMPFQGMVTRFSSGPPSFLAQLLSPLRAMADGRWQQPYMTEFLLAMAAAGLMAGAALFIRRQR